MTTDQELGKMDLLSLRLLQAQEISAALAAHYEQAGDACKTNDADRIHRLAAEARQIASELRETACLEG